MKYILGGGIAGLISAFYLKDYTILTEKIGGQLAKDFPLGPRFVKITSETVELFTALGLSLACRGMTVGYLLGGEIFASPTDEMIQIYREKTHRTDSEQKVMNMGKSYTLVFRDSDKLVPALIDSLKDRIKTGIRLTEIPREGGRFLVNTLPLDLLYSFLEMPVKLESYPILFLHDYSQNLWYSLRSCGMAYAYILDPHDPFYRVTLTEEPGRIVKESHWTNLQRLDHFQHIYVNPGRVMKGPDSAKTIITQGDRVIENVGRYAQWDPEIRIPEVIRRVKEVRDDVG